MSKGGPIQFSCSQRAGPVILCSNKAVHTAAQSSQNVSFPQVLLSKTLRHVLLFLRNCMLKLLRSKMSGHNACVVKSDSYHIVVNQIHKFASTLKHDVFWDLEVSADSLLYTLLTSAPAHCEMHPQKGRLALLIASSSPTFCASPCRLLESLWR